MTTIIGFIPPKGICQGTEVTLPIGFLETGERIEFNDHNFADCKLIFLKDIRYDLAPPSDDWNCFQGNEREALLFQHNSNSTAWDNQTKWLKHHGWNPRHFAGFSRTETEGEFMKATRKLLCDSDDCYETVIKDFLQRVGGKYLFKLLDNYVAWEILASLNEDYDTSRDTAFDLLPTNIKSGIPEEPLTDVINAANKQAFDLIQ